MLNVNLSSPRFSTILFTLVLIAAFAVSLSAQEAPAVHAGYTRITGLPDDWSHHHVVFASPGTERDAIKNGTHEHWLNTVNDPRYVIQQLKRNLPVQGPASEDVDFRYREAKEDRRGRDGWDDHRHHDRVPNSSAPSVHRDWSMSLGSAGGLKPGQYPAKYNFSTSAATCNDIVVFPAGLTGSGTQATIVGYNNLYAGTCGTANTRPGIAWSYWTQTGGTGTGGTSGLSPVISYTGDQVAYIQTVGTAAALVLLKPLSTSGGTVGAPATITYNTNATYRSCVAPCYTTIALSGPANDTNSAPYYDYNLDVMYVGDDSGVLHKFTGVFSGTPAEITGGGTGSGWPQTMTGGGILTSPVLDSTDGMVFVAGAGGFLFRIPPGGGSTNLVRSGQLAVTGSTGIVDAPIVDNTPSTPLVYVTVGDNNQNAGNNSVDRFATNFAAASLGTFVTLGAAVLTSVVYDGDFDNTHYSGTGATGNLYVCGTHTAGTAPSLFRVAIATFTGTATTVVSPTSGAATCSPATEFLNTGSGGSAVTTLTNTTLASTTLNGTITVGATAVTVTSAAGMAVGDYVLIDSELMYITVIAANTLTVTRGQLGTTGAAHTTGAVVDAYNIATAATTLNGAITNVATTLVVASSTGIGAGDYLLINTETMLVTNVAGTTITVTRAAQGSAAAAHIDGSPVTIYENNLPAATTSVNVASVTNIGVGDYIQMGTEDMFVSAIASNTLTVTRGTLGTTAAVQLNGTNVTIPQLEWLYLSVSALGTDTGCMGACVYSYSLTAGTPAAATTGLPAAGGTSGIIIDNSTITAGESQIYYTTLANQACVGNGTTGNTTGSCAVQVSQSGLN